MVARNLAVILLTFTLVGFGDTAWFDNREGNRLYGEHKYGEATEAYRSAKEGNKNEKGIDYNLGNSLFRTGEYEKAIESFTAATETGEATLKDNAMFNLGAAYYKAGENSLEAGDMEAAGTALKGSVDQYKNLLAQKPGDDDARHNLELAIEKLKMIEQQKQEQQKEEDKENKEQDEGSEDKEKSESQSDENKKRDKDESQQENKSDEQKDGDPQDQSKKEEPTQGMTPEKAQRILDAIENDEKALREKMKAALAGKQPPVEKDW